MFKKIVIVLVVVIAAFLAYAATRPATFEVSRSTVIAAPPQRVYDLINDFHNFPQWSPWQKLDPAMQVTYSGPQNGVGSSYAWSGNKQAGKGSMKITEATAPGKIKMDLDFIEPFAASNTVDFVLAPEGSGTRVTWTMRGHSNFMVKVMSMFVSMDQTIGPDFERGLANLKTVAETAH
ncbi:SRPBCC family protein [Solilutibacter silvestris]|uniref:Polyketide cyclase/dehydrase-related protein n=1 Tax=Solilutibacter silvestris TaxID=1645665 RepID=A0A2K1PYB4_9GAMM|nr:SRPBCC family protein [Lysobacter silvestris]PNS07771.1 Polyketide cyclase/dehydrase-related protein [Lysobacter silvestris]